MTETEGVINFDYALSPGEAALEQGLLCDLVAWRSILRELDLLGEDPERYGGCGYGNLSLRDGGGGFVITASQTSGARTLHREHLVRVLHADLDAFRIDAVGSRAPSSEALTHAMLYHVDDSVRCVFHVHSPTIWQARERLGLPTTAADVPYGTPAMARAVSTLMERHARRPQLFATAGHEDGVFAAGATAEACGALLVSCLARARALQPGATIER